MSFFVGDFSMAGQFGLWILRWWIGVAWVSDSWDHVVPEGLFSVALVGGGGLGRACLGRERTWPGSQFWVDRW